MATDSATATTAAAPARRGRPSTGARERILEAAIEVLKSDGYAGLTIAKVAAAAGESKPLVAYHFGSKQGLVEASGRAVAELVTAEALNAVEGARTVEQVVRGVADGVERLLERDERLARLYFDLAAVSVVEQEVRRTITEKSAIAVFGPSPVVLLRKSMMCPDCSPPKTNPPSRIFSST